MLQLFALKVVIAVWKASISLSKQLRPRTWIIFAVMSALISIAAFSAYNAKSVPDWAIPPVAHLELKPVPLPTAPRAVFNVALSGPGVSEFKLYSIVHFSGHGVVPYMHISAASRSEHFTLTIYGLNYDPGVLLYAGSEMGQLQWKLPDWPATPWPIVVQVPDSQAPDLLSYFEKRVALAVSVITALLSIINLFLAFQALRTFKAERELKNLQIAHLRLEVEKLRQEIEDAKREKEKTNGIILVS